jgi:hypothetical protein
MTVSNVTLPSNFFDVTSPKLLTQPEPEYIYAKLAMAALSGDLEGADSPMGHIGREIAGSGAAYVNLDQDRLALAGSIMSDAVVTPIDGNWVGLPGTTVRFNRPKYTNSTYTLASRRIGPNASISTTPLTVDSEQAPITLERFAGPYGTSAVQPYGIDKFAANLGVHKLSSIVGKHMKRDYHRWLNAVMTALYDLGTAIYPDGTTTDDTIGAAGANWLTLDQILKTQQTMDDANLPRFSDGHRLLVLPPAGVRHLKNDQAFNLASQYFPEVNAIFARYIKTVESFHIIESTTLSTATNSSSNTVYYGHAIAPGGVGVAAGEPARVAYSNDDNYGETAKVIWLAYHAFAELDNRMTYVVKFGA